MSKKQANKKLVNQNKRNRLANRRYSSIIKTLLKLFKNKLKSYTAEENEEAKILLKSEAQNVGNRFYSIVDKAIKRNVIHQNNGAHKKSKVGRILSKL